MEQNKMTTDPKDSVGAALISIGKFYADATAVSDALSTHLRTTHGDPPLHASLQRLQLALGELRHAVNNVEPQICEHLRSAIAATIAVPSEPT
jgi:hypothetical protein